MPGLTKKQMEEFLKRPLLVKVATITPDGWPHVTPAWFAYEKGRILLVGRKHSSWVKNILKNKKVSLVIDDPDPPQPKVHVTGEAQVLEGPVVNGKWVKIAEVMANKYFGGKVGPKYLGGTIDQPRYLIAVPMTKVVTWIGSGAGDRGEWHHKYYDKGTKWYKEYSKTKTAKVAAK
ncbi:MAG: pyridoxamine 5'-phosphate oxidase family protein [Nitrososphaerota archaeon]|nr:pyridoxamine 5'-phosphate oxidase family protein [Nitrososphaerota archaeon]